MRILYRKGYNQEEISQAFVKISLYNESERKKGEAKVSQDVIKKMISKRTIYSYILREALHAIIVNCNEGKLGNISKTNISLYQEVAIALYNELVTLLQGNYEGQSYVLA